MTTTRRYGSLGLRHRRPGVTHPCDECGREADTVHFLPYVTRCERVEFACPRHDPGGYWSRLPRAATVQFWDHISHKRNGADAVIMLQDRLTE